LNDRYTVKIRDERGDVVGDCLVNGLNEKDGPEPCKFYQVLKEHLTPSTPSFAKQVPTSPQAPAPLDTQQSTISSLPTASKDSASSGCSNTKPLKSLRKDAFLKRTGAVRFKFFQACVHVKARFCQVASLVIGLLCLLNLPASVSAGGSSENFSSPPDVLTKTAVLGVAAASASTAAASVYRRVHQTKVNVTALESPSNVEANDSEATDLESDRPISSQARPRTGAGAAKKALKAKKGKLLAYVCTVSVKLKKPHSFMSTSVYVLYRYSKLYVAF
jgi:hypothetical protein